MSAGVYATEFLLFRVMRGSMLYAQQLARYFKSEFIVTLAFTLPQGADQLLSQRRVRKTPHVIVPVLPTNRESGVN